jgi:acyl carrier protein
MRTYILDPSLRPVPVGVPGELFLAGAGVARGYLRRPELTAEKFLPNPFSRKFADVLFRSGDRARYTEDGLIEYLGRGDRQVKIRGFRVELEEVESTLAQHSRVGVAVVADREDRTGNRQLVAYVVPREGREIPGAELREFLRERLPEHMVPSVIVHFDRLPLTPSGKVDRRALQAGEKRPDQAATYIAPRTPLETKIAAMWSQIFGVDRVGVDDTFFALGGHSLLAMQLISRIRDAFHVELPLRTMFQDPTVGGLADAIARLAQQEHESQPETIVPVVREQFAVSIVPAAVGN